MAPALRDSMDKIRGFWSRTSMSQRVFVGGIAVVVVVAFFIMIMVMNRENYQVLYTNLAPEDASRVVEILKKEKVPYKLTNNGNTVMAPEAQVYELRLKIAGEGGMVGQGVGFEIFDQIKVGQTDFVQKINYQRALQGELSRTISEFPAVEKARVHLVLPAKSLFIEDERPPSASVVLKMLEGQKMDNKEVQAIVNLVTMAVEGLDKGRITVADTNGQLLYQPTDDGTLEGMTTTQLEYKREVQRQMERRVEEMLYPIAGPGRVIAKVNADLDFSKKTIHKELYDPDSAVLRSEQRSEEVTQGQANTEAGVPETNFRGDEITGAISRQESTRETRASNFEINKEEQSIISQPGELQRISVAVIVDGTYQMNEETGEYIFTPRAEEELERIQQLVANAVGMESARGDTIEVTSISFGGPEIEEEPSLMAIIADYALRLGKPLLNALLIFLFLVLVVRPVILALIRPRVEGEAVEGLEGLPDGEERLALIEAEEEESDIMDALKKIEDIKAHALQLSEQNMDQAVNILKSWLKNQEGAKVGRAA